MLWNFFYETGSQKLADGIREVLKLLGKDIANFYCMDCLADFLGCTVDDLLDKIEEFKDEGCTLFK